MYAAYDSPSGGIMNRAPAGNTHHITPAVTPMATFPTQCSRLTASGGSRMDRKVCRCASEMTRATRPWLSTTYTDMPATTPAHRSGSPGEEAWNADSTASQADMASANIPVLNRTLTNGVLRRDSPRRVPATTDGTTTTPGARISPAVHTTSVTVKVSISSPWRILMGNCSARAVARARNTNAIASFACHLGRGVRVATRPAAPPAVTSPTSHLAAGGRPPALPDGPGGARAPSGPARSSSERSAPAGARVC